MAHRSFVDENGTAWAVWDVYPQWVERRARQRRLEQGHPTRQERRRRPDRRITQETGPRLKLHSGYEQGWLTFECAGEKRRLVPIPLGWEGVSNAVLAKMCGEARPVETGSRR